ncbi:MAG: type I-E CRISPR-associated protein Cse1/CasA [Pseudomonadota bacterium]
MTFNLLDEQWIPVRTSKGKRRRIAPWEMTSTLQDDPIAAVNSPRADFNGALIQFLIGLVQTSELIPPREPEWGRDFRSPPDPATLRRAFDVHRDAFFLSGDGPRFLQDMQDLALHRGAQCHMADLLMDIPGNGHFVKARDRDGFCFGCTATALYCLQTNAPEGGRGNFTGLRGGGPLTTIVLPPHERLWETVWLNVVSKEDLASMPGNASSNGKQYIFPWLAPTRTGAPTFPHDVHPLQLYWSMPRRIRIDFATLGSGICDICGEASDSLVQRYFTRPHGVAYRGPWKHPLTPYSVDKDGAPLSRKARAGSINYRNWIGLVVKNTETADKAGVQQLPALVVERFMENRRNAVRKGSRAPLWGFGYDMDHMRARCWFDGKIPIHAVSDHIVRAYEVQTERMVRAAITIGNYLNWCLKQAWFSERATVRGDFGFMDTAFWTGSEPDFFQHLNNLIDELEGYPGEPPAATLRSWHRYLCRLAMRLFDEYAASGPIEDEDPARIAKARNKLKGLNWGKKVRVDILQLPEEQKTATT